MSMSEPTNASNFDERINRLIERHEALTQTVEHMALQGEEQNGRIAKMQTELEKIIVIQRETTVHVNALAHLAEIQNERLTRLEGGPA
jgi:hypothetical protein